jgi:hypothetical protein
LSNIDVYEPGCEFEKAKSGNPIYDTIKKSIDFGDDLCKRYPQYNKPNMATVILFKEKPETKLLQKLTEVEYQLPEVYNNPFL